MIQLDMLLVKSSNPEERGRISSEEVHFKLANMLERCRTDRDYACKPAPWSNPLPTSDEEADNSIVDTKIIISQTNVEHAAIGVQIQLQQDYLAVPALKRRVSFAAANSCLC
jgi:hypothetical protein